MFPFLLHSVLISVSKYTRMYVGPDSLVGKTVRLPICE